MQVLLILRSKIRIMLLVKNGQNIQSTKISFEKFAKYGFTLFYLKSLIIFSFEPKIKIQSLRKTVAYN